VRVITRQ